VPSALFVLLLWECSFFFLIVFVSANKLDDLRGRFQPQRSYDSNFAVEVMSDIQAHYC